MNIIKFKYTEKAIIQFACSGIVSEAFYFHGSMSPLSSSFQRRSKRSHNIGKRHVRIRNTALNRLLTTAPICVLKNGLKANFTTNQILNKDRCGTGIIPSIHKIVGEAYFLFSGAILKIVSHFRCFHPLCSTHSIVRILFLLANNLF